jgi:tripartite ATP-independent transporter DctM subunit
MSDIAQFSIVISVFLALLLCGMWIPFAISIAASTYIYLASGWDGFGGLGLASWGSVNSFTLTAIPLFILMAEFMMESGLSLRVYRGLSYIVRGLPGRLLQTNVAGCAVFAAISGSSVATAVAIGSVALPQLEERGYSRSLAAGTIAAGGTLGILIPPSIAMIIYGTFTDTSISKLFMAGVLPGLALVAIFMIYVAIRCMLNPSLAPPVRQIIADLVPFGLLILGVMGSLYAGIATPTEAAGIGAFMAAVISLIWGNLTWGAFRRSLRKTVQATGAILFIVYAAYLFSYAIAMVGVTDELTEMLRAWNLSTMGLLLAIVVLYTVLGFVMDSIGIMVITVPILHPILTSYGIDPIWFGVLMVLLIELGQIHPPVGLNLFVVKSVSPKATFGDVIKGIVPFCGLIYLLMAILIIVPQLALWLPGNMT